MARLAVAAALCVLATCAAAQEGPTRANHTLLSMLAADCDECTKHGNSAYCESGSGLVTVDGNVVFDNANASSGYCWFGTFGTMKHNSPMHYDSILDTDNVTIVQELSCGIADIKYNQCALSVLVAIILMAVAFVVVVTILVSTCFCCGWCRCCNAEGDNSNCGGCKRCMKCQCCDGKGKKKKKAREGRRMTNNPMIDPSKTMF